MLFTDSDIHVIFDCSLSETLGQNVMSNIEREFSRVLVTELSHSPVEEALQFLIGRKTHLINDKKIHKHFLRIDIAFVSKCIFLQEKHLYLPNNES